MSELEKEFVPHTESLELKELEFDEPCLMCYRGESGLYSHSIGGYASEITLKSNTDLNTYLVNEKEDYWVAAPTFSQALRWFREKHNMRFCIIDDHSNNEKPYSFTSEHEYFYDTGTSNDWFSTYEKAELACIIKLIEKVKNK
jgi:hypothetical protein